MGNHRQKRSAARAGRGRPPRHHHQAGVPADEEAARLPRPKQANPKWASSLYLLSGILRCESCGRAMSPSEAKSGKYIYHICQSLMKRSSGACKTPRLNAKKIENTIVDELRANILTQSYIRDLVKLLDEEMDGAAREHRQNLESIEAKLEDVKK